ncbi:MAG: pentapeptide repeat-containing protein [Pseudomonadota bacterium]
MTTFAGVIFAALLIGVFIMLVLNEARHLRKTGRHLDPWDWLRRHYWKVLLAAGILLGLAAIGFYLAEIGFAVSAMVDRLRKTAATATPEDLRNLATGIAVLLASLAAAATLIFQLVRVWITERTTTATEEGLVTDRINTAVENLGATRVTYDADGKATTEANLEVRIGALYSLERIGKDSPRDHIQIMEILCAYIRENSNARTPVDFPRPEPLAEDASEEERKAFAEAKKERLGSVYYMSAAWEWAHSDAVPRLRTDIQAALEIVGRRDSNQIRLERNAEVRGSVIGYRIDLTRANLQRADLSEMNFEYAILAGVRLEGADLSGAKMESADLSRARMEGADLSGAYMADLSGAYIEGNFLYGVQMEGADLSEARMKGADLRGAQMEGAYFLGAQMEGAQLLGARMEGANLNGARMEGVDFRWARFDDSTRFGVASNFAAALGSVDFTGVDVPKAFLEGAFGDGSVVLPEGYNAGEPPLAHWAPEKLDDGTLEDRWQAILVMNGLRQPGDD